MSCFYQIKPVLISTQYLSLFTAQKCYIFVFVTSTCLSLLFLPALFWEGWGWVWMGVLPVLNLFSYSNTSFGLTSLTYQSLLPLTCLGSLPFTWQGPLPFTCLGPLPFTFIGQLPFICLGVLITLFRCVNYLLPVWVFYFVFVCVCCLLPVWVCYPSPFFRSVALFLFLSVTFYLFGAITFNLF